MGCPIRKSTDQRLLAASRGLSQLAASFIACWHQGIHRIALSSLITKVNLPSLPFALRLGVRSLRKLSELYYIYALFLYLCVVVKEHLASPTAPKVFSPERCSVQLRNSCCNRSDFSEVVGLTGLEPVTPRLSSACSNQLSYTPKSGGQRSRRAQGAVRRVSLFT